MTIPEIIKAVSAVVGSYSEPTFYRDVRRLNIKPNGFRQRPQNYSPNVVNTILFARGRSGIAIAPTAPLSTASARLQAIEATRLATLAQLRSERKKAKVSR